MSSSATAKAAALKTSKKGLQRPAARYDGIGKIGGGHGKACCKACLVGVVGLAGLVWFGWSGWGGWGGCGGWSG